MKYVIEIDDKKLCEYDKDTATYFPRLWKAKGFNALVFDQIGIDKLTPLDKELEEAYQRGLDEGYNNGYSQGLKDGCHKSDTEEYQQGLEDAWKCAKKLFSEMSDAEIDLVFPQEWNNGGFKALMSLDPRDAIDMIKTYEERKKADAEIKVGDEVIALRGKAIVIRRYKDKYRNNEDSCEYWYYDMSKIDHDATSNLRKTGRHFPQVAELLKAMKGGDA